MTDEDWSGAKEKLQACYSAYDEVSDTIEDPDAGDEELRIATIGLLEALSDLWHYEGKKRRKK